MLEYNLLQKIEYIAKNNKVVLLRSCNSSWQQNLFAKLSDGRMVINLADPMLRELAMWQPVEFLKQYGTNLFLMNVQFAPKLLEIISSSEENYHCLAVVSQAYYIMEEYQNVDGVITVDLPIALRKNCVPFLPATEQLRELSKSSISVEEVFNKIYKGNLLSEEVTFQKEREVLYGAYVQNFLQHDIKMATPISDEMKFYRFVCNVAASVGKVVNYALLGNTVDISSPTAKQWMAYLEGAGVVTLLEAIDNPSLKRVAKAPKIYFTDTGLAAYLLRLQSAQEIATSAFADGLFENWVVLQLRNSYLQNGFEAKLNYFKDSNAKEINLLLEYNDCIYPIDIRKEPEISIKKQQKKFRLIAPIEQDGRFKIGNGCILSICQEVQEVDANLWIVPVGAI